ncbi:FlgB family protein [Oceaniglobus trochenteri]|uniref:FlgB family protein n=1 Tax=Oceaniglobus trochenteri TaxID=2763260 RepID=UPI001CFF563F|nr:FlgB family protein [Oceaniglobus trochenteri]
MFDNIETMQTAQAMARHAAQRQALVARNVANADTPGYRARDMPDFAQSMGQTAPATNLRATRAGHIAQGPGTLPTLGTVEAGDEPSPNGNTVSLEHEMIRAAEIRQQHDMAMAIYGKARDILRASIGRGQ